MILKVYRLFDMNHDELREYNKRTIEFSIHEVREHIKNGTLRNLVEERCCSSTEAMTALRILDRDHSVISLTNIPSFTNSDSFCSSI